MNRLLALALVWASLLSGAVPALAGWIPFQGRAESAPDCRIRSQSWDSIVMEVEIPGVGAETVVTKIGPFTRLDFPDEAFKGAVGTPRLPVIRAMLKVPYGAEIELEYRASGESRFRLDDLGIPHPLLPVQPPVPKLPGAAERAPFIMDGPLYSSDEFLGGEAARIQDDDLLRGNRIVVLEITPIAYNPARNEIRCVSRLEIRLNFKNPDRTLTRRNALRYYSRPYDQLLGQLVLNRDTYRNFEFPPGAPISYLIIAHSDYQSALSSFVEWKRACGYDVHVENAPGGATTATIKAIIQNAYDSWTNPPDYVLLAGDTDTIPCYTGESSGSEDDNQYTELEGTGYWTPDVMIGRLPGRSTADFNNMLTKILQVEQMTMSAKDYFKDSVWLASSDHATMLEATHQWCYDNHVEPIDPSHNTMHQVYERLGGDTADFADNVNAGRSIVCYSGHGYGDGSGTASVPFGRSNVEALTNSDRYGQVMVFACGTNLYSQSSPQSFGELWVLSANKGSASYWGTSDSSYWDEDDWEEREIYRCQHEDLIHTLSAMYFKGLIKVYTQGGASAYYFDIYNLMGDPSTDLVTRIPETPEIVCADTTSPAEQDFNVTVNAGGAGRAGVLVAVTQSDTLLGAAYTNAAGVATVHFTPLGAGSAAVRATGHNLIPGEKSLLISAAGCGVISLDQTVYGCEQTITMTVWDSDLNANPAAVETASADISSSSEPTPEARTLTETGPNTGAFSGTIQGSPSQGGTGFLLLADGDTITAHYHDADCEGSPAEVYDTATDDCRGPAISNVQVVEIGLDTATVTWDTDEAADSCVTYGTALPPGTAVTNAALVTSHQVVLPGLTASTRYYVKVASTDASGNGTEDTNGGSYYRFDTMGYLLNLSLDTDPGWTISGGQWAWGTPTGGGGAWGDPDPTSGYTGSTIYGYNLAGDYANSIPAYTLTSTAIDCSSAGNVGVSFWRWLGVEESTYDHAVFSVSNNGSTWNSVWSNTATLSDGAWTHVEYDISAYADGQATVYLRWTMGPTDSSLVYCGWNIDDVQVFGNVSGDAPTPSPLVATPTPRVATPTPAFTPPAFPTPTPTCGPNLAPARDVIASGDYDGDGSAEIAIFRPSTGLWSVKEVTRRYFGSSSDQAVPGDYDGDGTAEIAIFRDASGLWSILGLTRAYFGTSGDRASPSDYDGDGSCDLGIFRENGGLWSVRGLSRFYFGSTNDWPIPGDFDNDGTAEAGLYRGSSGQWMIRNFTRSYFGASTDWPVPGDYLGTGERFIGIFRPCSGMWAIRDLTRICFGNCLDYPRPADFDGDGADDIGIFRDSAGLWSIRYISRVYFGTAGDLPVTR